MATKREIEDFRLRTPQDLCKLAEMLGYGGRPEQLQCNNGAFVSSLLAFFDDNPGALEAVKEFIEDNIDCYELDEDDEDEDSDEENEHDDFPCPGCGCKPGDGMTEGCEAEEGCGYFRSLMNDNDK